MSYLVLARKYRPRRFAEMAGQEHVVRALSNALSSGRLHHAYLFTGTRGIGKTTVSRILAKSLNCTGPDGRGGVTAEPCGVCAACTEIDADRFIDYIELDAASNRSIDEVRDLIERAAYKPGVGRYKVFMIDEAHQLTKDAFNALLKTLEEPPEYLKFVLATTDPEKMLPTVLSRCLQFNLRPMAPETVREHLRHVLAAEGVPSDDGALRLLARAARGSMRDALSLTDQAIAYGGGRVDEAVVRAMLGAVDRGHAARLVEALAQRDGAGLLSAVDALRAQGTSAVATADEIAALLQGMAIEQAVPGALDATDPDTADARRLAPRLAPDETQLLYGIVVHGRGELSLLGDEHAALTMVLLRFLAFPPAAAAGASPPAVPEAAASAAPTPEPPAASPAAAPAAPRRTDEPPPWLDDVPPDDAAATPSAAAPRARPLRAPAGATAVVAPAATAVDDGAEDVVSIPADLGDRWAGVVGRLVAAGAIAALVRELAWQAGLRAVDETGAPPRWHLVVERDSLRSPLLRDRLVQALQGTLGATVQLELEAGVPSDSPARRDAEARARRQREAEAAVREDPLVRMLLGQFPTARLVPGSIRPL
ncbi:MAG: DNA polymerase III subunit gamma/tau [Rubrivivax sp.]|nr:DNA polymerase III subunit gamma/tau [Rubrivivax sp.]